MYENEGTSKYIALSGLWAPRLEYFLSSCPLSFITIPLQWWWTLSDFTICCDSSFTLWLTFEGFLENSRRQTSRTHQRLRMVKDQRRWKQTANTPTCKLPVVLMTGHRHHGMWCIHTREGRPESVLLLCWQEELPQNKDWPCRLKSVPLSSGMHPSYIPGLSFICWSKSSKQLHTKTNE